MSEWLSSLSQQFRALPPGRRVALVGTAAGSLAFFLWLATSANRAEYRLLYRGLAEDQAVQVVEGLDAEKIPYRLSEGGTAVYVPGPLVYEARIRVAGRGLPGGSGAGFEIFDEAGFGVTDFVQKVNFQRALQGELSRSIEQLDPVERARVQIAMAERSGFLREDEPDASASVVVRLRAGEDLDETQVRGIVHLVASSVHSLSASRVTLVDTRGRMLAPVADQGAGPRAPAGSLAQQGRLERELGERVESILERTVGVGRVVARVRADLDWSQTERTEERFDPDSQVARSEQRSTDSSRDRSGIGAVEGVPGVRANQPGGVAAAGGPESERTASRTSETINYEISKVVSRRVESVGTVQRLDVAVLVDGKPDAQPAGGESAYVPWSQEELQQFEELARRAVGFSSERGDRITVTSAPFRSIEIGEEEGFALDPQLLALASTLLNYVGLVVALLLFARLVGKPVVTALAAGARAAAAAPMTAADLEASLAAEAAGAGGASVAAKRELTPAPPPPSLQEQVGSLTDSRSEDSVKTLRGWLDQ